MTTKPSHQLSLVTFNTLGTPLLAPDITKRYQYIAQEINKRDYDIICLQELFTYYHFFLFKKTLTNYPYVIYQKNPLGPRGGLVIFSKLKLTTKEFFTYIRPSHANVPLYVPLAQPGMLSAIIESFGIRICTTHLSSDVVHNLTPKNKLYQLIKSQTQEAAKLVNQYTKNGYPLILTGDFNIAKHSDLHEEFIKQTSASDVFVKEERPTYDPDRTTFFYKSPPGRIDFIFTKSRQEIKPILTEHIFIDKIILEDGKKSYPSDHIGLHCILNLNK